MKPLQVGDRIKYRREFLETLGDQAEELRYARGAIVSLTTVTPTVTRAQIDWEFSSENLPTQSCVDRLTLATDPELGPDFECESPKQRDQRLTIVSMLVAIFIFIELFIFVKSKTDPVVHHVLDHLGIRK